MGRPMDPYWGFPRCQTFSATDTRGAELEQTANLLSALLTAFKLSGPDTNRSAEAPNSGVVALLRPGIHRVCPLPV